MVGAADGSYWHSIWCRWMGGHSCDHTPGEDLTSGPVLITVPRWWSHFQISQECPLKPGHYEGDAPLSGSPAAVLQWQALCSCSVLKLPVEELLKLAIVHLEVQ